MSESVERFSRLSQLRGEEMRTPDEVAAMLTWWRWVGVSDG